MKSQHTPDAQWSVRLAYAVAAYAVAVVMAQPTGMRAREIAAASFVTPGLAIVPEWMSATDCESIIDGASAQEMYPTPTLDKWGYSVVDPTFRISDTIRLSHAWPWIRVNSYKQRLETTFGVSARQVGEPHVTRYQAGGHLQPHVDSGSDRMITTIVYLNSVNVTLHGGGTRFPYHGFIVQPQVGKLLTFDILEGMLARQDMMHESMPLTGNVTKRILVTFIHLPPDATFARIRTLWEEEDRRRVNMPSFVTEDRQPSSTTFVDTFYDLHHPLGFAPALRETVWWSATATATA